MTANINARGFRYTTGDATGNQLAILLPTAYRVLHVASAADAETDWNVANPTHPTFYVHSETTPATDYIAFDHDATDGTINVASGNLKLALSGTDVLTLTTTALTPSTADVGTLGTGTLMWGDLFLASGGVINFNNGNVALTHSAAALAFTGGTFRLADGNALLIGHSAKIPVGAVTSEVEVIGTAPADSTIALQAWSADAVPPRLYFAKSRSATMGTFGIITSGDNLGEILAFGDDGVDFNSNGNASAAIIFDSTGTIAADRIPGTITFQTATNAAPSVLTTAMTISEAQVVDLPAGDLTVGTTGTTTGKVRLDGATSGTVTVTAVAAAGTWTMTLPTGVAGTGGFQLTDASGDGVCTWAAASLGAWKNDLGILDPYEALEAVVSAPTHVFTYRPEVMPPGVWAPPDRMTGIFSEEAPWAMHGENGIAFSMVNSFGYARAAIQALNEKIERLEGALA